MDIEPRDLAQSAATPEAMLWLAVIKQAIDWSHGRRIKDAIAATGSVDSERYRRMRAKRIADARDWLAGPECARVCDMLGIDAGWVRERVA